MSGRFTHHAGGAFAGLVVGDALMIGAGWTLPRAVALAAVAAATGGGVWSPDVDQSKAWRMVDKAIPDEWLGGGGPLQHRNITHWVGWPVVMVVAWRFLVAAHPGLAVASWVGFGVAVGWASHLMLDFLYGLPVRIPEGYSLVVRGGVPLLPWGWHVGGFWRSGGIGSATAGLVLLVGVVWELDRLGLPFRVQVGLAVLVGVAGVVSWLVEA